MKQRKLKPIGALSKTLDGGVNRIEAILNYYDPFEQNKIIGEIIKNTAIKRFEDDEVARSRRNKTMSALDEFVTQNPKSKYIIEELNKAKEYAH
jgi:hypothetical protein